MTRSRNTAAQDSQEPQVAVHDCKDLPFLCIKCDSLLGFVDKETKSEIRVKYRDLYLGAIDAEVFWILCRSCGHKNRLEKARAS